MSNYSALSFLGTFQTYLFYLDQVSKIILTSIKHTSQENPEHEDLFIDKWICHEMKWNDRKNEICEKISSLLRSIFGTFVKYFWHFCIFFVTLEKYFFEGESKVLSILMELIGLYLNEKNFKKCYNFCSEVVKEIRAFFRIFNSNFSIIKHLWNLYGWR